MSPAAVENRRVLVIDDNEAIHSDFDKILRANSGTSSLVEIEAALFGETRRDPRRRGDHGRAL